MNITKNMVLNWLGDDQDTESLAEYLASLLNGHFAIETARNEIITYNEENGE